jgi:hypothetical protein
MGTFHLNLGGFSDDRRTVRTRLTNNVVLLTLQSLSIRHFETREPNALRCFKYLHACPRLRTLKVRYGAYRSIVSIKGDKLDVKTIKELPVQWGAPHQGVVLENVLAAWKPHATITTTKFDRHTVLPV